MALQNTQPQFLMEPMLEAEPCPTCGHHGIMRIRRSEVILPKLAPLNGQAEVKRSGVSMVGRCLGCGRGEYWEPNLRTRFWEVKKTVENWGILPFAEKETTDAAAAP